jgi:hypothetical protein
VTVGDFVLDVGMRNGDDAARRRGVYTLANDGVYDWLVAFLESMREHEPDLPIVVIPFDDRIDRIARLRSTYRFDIMDDPLLAETDRMGATYYPGDALWPHAFRKLAAFWGPFENFAFFDSDVVILQPLREYFDKAEVTPGFVCGDLDVAQCFVPGNLRDAMLSTGQITGFNTGFFMSRRNAFTFEHMQSLADEGLAIKNGFTFGDQPFINWCVSTAGMTVTPYYDLLPDVCFSTWAERRPIRRVDGTWRLLDKNWQDVGRRMPWLHWAGSGLDMRMPNIRIFLHYRLAHATLRERAEVVGRWTTNSTRRTAKAAGRRIRRLGPSTP